MKTNKTIFTDDGKKFQMSATFGAYKFTKLAIKLETACEILGAFEWIQHFIPFVGILIFNYIDLASLYCWALKPFNWILD